MKTLQNNFTTPEQSKRLLELGVPRCTADEYRDKKGFRHSLEGILDVELYFQNFPECTPCWSVGQLMEIYRICRDGALPANFISRKQTILDFYLQAYEDNIDRFDFSKLEE